MILYNKSHEFPRIYPHQKNSHEAVTNSSLYGRKYIPINREINKYMHAFIFVAPFNIVTDIYPP